MKRRLLDWAEAAAAGPALAGGKGWQLGLLAGLGLPVPAGFVIPATAAAARHCGQPLPAAWRDELTDELRRRQWLDVPLAVRSSAVAEDAEQASFAGIFRTRLNVRGLDALTGAVQEVHDSAHAAAAQAYRERLDLPAHSADMAVIVMPLLPAVASGVAFSSDPAGGRADELVIHATWGLGEALVDGQIEPDEYRLRRHYPSPAWQLTAQRCGSKRRISIAAATGGTHRHATPAAQAERAVFGAAQATALAALVNDAAHALDYSRPFYDVEWVWDGTQFWLVQARPITARAPRCYAALAGQPELWSRGNSRDVTPDPFPALDWSMSAPLIEHMLTRNARAGGYRVLPGLRRTRLHQGRLYFDTSLLQWEAFDAFGVAPQRYNALLGGHQPEIAVPAAPLRERLRRAWHGTRFLLSQPLPRWRADSTLDRAHRQAAEQLAEVLPDAAAELTQQLRQTIDRIYRAEDLMLLQASGSAFSLLLDLLERHVPGEGAALAAGLMSGGEASVSAQLTQALLHLAGIAANDAAAMAWLHSPGRAAAAWQQALPQDSPFRQAFATFLQRYGHRAVYESYLHRPRWHEAPDYLLDTVIGLAGCRADTQTQRQRDAQAAALVLVRQHVPACYRPAVAWLTACAISERNSRERARSALIAQCALVRRLVLALAQQLLRSGALAERDDVFHLTVDELLAWAEGRLPSAASLQRSRWRRRQYAAFTQKTVPELIVTPRRAAVHDADVIGATPAAVSGDVWHGAVVGSGCAAGPAYLAHRPEQAVQLPTGAVLVVPATDPAWTPAFLKAAAVVMETGGYLSHGAIVARELGIPAVVNVQGILQQLKDGDRLEVDAQRGQVRRL